MVDVKKNASGSSSIDSSSASSFGSDRCHVEEKHYDQWNMRLVALCMAFIVLAWPPLINLLVVTQSITNDRKYIEFSLSTVNHWVWQTYADYETIHS